MFLNFGARSIEVILDNTVVARSLKTGTFVLGQAMERRRPMLPSGIDARGSVGEKSGWKQCRRPRDCAE